MRAELLKWSNTHSRKEFRTWAAQYLSKDWLVPFTDTDHNPNISLENTNDISENRIRNLVPTNKGGKKFRIHTALAKVADTLAWEVCG